MVRLEEHVARMGAITFAYKIMVGNPERMRSLGSPRRTCQDNIKIDKETGIRGVNCIQVSKGRF
jgi:hypothetical protein